MNPDEPVVVTDRLTKRYGELVALDSLTISLDRGQILGFIGPNGAGKTTTINILVGLARPTAGSARIAGADCLRDARKIKHLVGYLPDTFGSYDNMRVREYLDFFGASFGIPRVKRVARIQEVLELLDAVWMQDRFVESLSHGMQQRVGLARTILHDPDVLILDEPANGLDPQARIEMRGILLRLAKMGKTLIVTSHVLPELARICHRVAIITAGRLRAFGTLDEIMRSVRAQRTIEAQLVSADGIAAAAQKLRQVAQEATDVVTSVEEATIRFSSSMSDRRLSEVLARMIGEGVEIAQFRELQSDLEDAFLSVVQDNAAEDSDRAPCASVEDPGDGSSLKGDRL
jgi:ABC-2 type transport system ATP-binding protein